MLLCVGFMLMFSAAYAEAQPQTKGPEAAAAQPKKDMSDSPEAQEKRRTASFEAGAAKREVADRLRTDRLERISNSICIGCGGPAVPFDPTGGAPSLQKPRPRAQAR